MRTGRIGHEPIVPSRPAGWQGADTRPRGAASPISGIARRVDSHAKGFRLGGDGARRGGRRRVATHYERLGVAPTASVADIRAAYRVLARQNHPDLASGPERASEAAAEMAEVNEAWHVLGDTERRAAYDATLESDRRRREPARPGTARAGPRSGAGTDRRRTRRSKTTGVSISPSPTAGPSVPSGSWWPSPGCWRSPG